MPRSTQLVQALLERQLDAEPDRDAAGLAGAPVGRLHRPRAAAGDDGVAGVGPAPHRAARPAAYSASSGVVRAEPKTLTAGRARPARRSPRRTRSGSAAPATGRCAPSRPGPRSSSSRWSVVVGGHLAAAQRDRTGVVLVGRSRSRSLFVAHVTEPTRPAAARHGQASQPQQRRLGVDRICSTGTCSSSVCARFGSPGPKFTAGMPSAANRATSVQPYFGRGRRRRPRRRTPAAAGWSSPGRAPRRESVDRARRTRRTPPARGRAPPATVVLGANR